jgi:ketosteroid isomerase-like protein
MRHLRAAAASALLLTVIAAGLSAAGAVLPPMQSPPPALLKMADTERAFARRAAETTIRQAFIDFFADEAVGFEPDPVPARESLRKREAPPQPAGFQLLWEPRLGDVSSSGDLGYLTGPAEYVMPGKPNTYTCYFSIWKRQADGEYRVILDVGVPTPEKTAFAPGFVRSAAVGSWKGRQSREEAQASLLAFDKAFAAALAAKGASQAFASVMHSAGRLNRRGFQPMPKSEAEAWLAREVTEMTSEPLKAETAEAGDLGYTYGRYSAKGPKATVSSHYVRVWTRKADGSWQLVSDVTTPPASK